MKQFKPINPFDLIFPKICLNCGIRINSDEKFLCNNCFSSLHYFSENYCEICGGLKEENSCRICETNDFLFDKARSAYQLNSTLSKLIHSFKYEEMTSLGKFMAIQTAEFVRKYNPFEKVDFITPVPLHTVKTRIRGFNQAEVLSAEIGKNLNIRHLSNLVLRKRFTETQTKLSRKNRIKNVSNAFGLNKKYNIKRKNILIIDDVFTTGSTVNAICSTLKNSGADKVFVLTIARA
ncbi:MAG: ComF family protein [Candidatus Cloacimonetes bacterium]|nr:ComF family protein [Candidatus Cloacimonadota bacterium]